MPHPDGFRNVYLLLLLLHTLASSFIWGINTLFLLDAGLSNVEAFAANAFFTAGMVVFEVPTGVVADTRGRRASYLLGTLTLVIGTLLYLLMWYASAPFWAWALTSAFLGLGFTFFSGAVEAWLVDGLTSAGYLREGGKLETVLAKGEIVEGIAMLTGSVAGGVIAQMTNLGVPYMLRALVLVVSFIIALSLMRDVGFTPNHNKRMIQEVRTVLRGSIEHGLGNPPSLIASKERATVLSFDSLLGSGGAVVTQPILGRVADIWSYPVSYVCTGALQMLSIPFIGLARRQRASADVISLNAAPNHGS